MNHLFPPLLAKEGLRPPVLAIAAHPDDEVIACGGMLAWHASVGHQVTVVHLTAGAAGDPDARFGDIRSVRQQEGREALRRLGITDLRSFDFTDGGVPEQQQEVEAELRRLFLSIQPKTLYSFFFTECHRDHRAVARAVASTADTLAPDCRVLLFGVNQVVVGGSMFEVGAQMDVKQQALGAFKSQLAYNDFRTKILHRDHAATVNVEDPTVQHAELFADLRPYELPTVRDRAEALYGFLLRDER